MHRILSVIILFFVLNSLVVNNSLAFDYFGSEIDYWNKKEARKKQPEKKEMKKTHKKERFNWNQYLDPKNDEFFEEGDYKPPKPFMEVARNPSDENIKNWFALIEAKNKLMSRLQANLSRYLTDNQMKLKDTEKEAILREINDLPQTTSDPYRFRFRLYFDSNCHHCKNMMQTMQDLQKEGYFVEVRQVDQQKPSYTVPFPIFKATKEELKDKKISAWPVLFVADSKTKQIYRLDGYLSSQKVLQILSNK
ncbi:MAG: TlpA family protein disulfide reductase [Oligoflexales bacterium]